jgi:CubicO group peptidase (beta-lactamase class C family)
MKLLRALFLFACSIVCLAADRLDINAVDPVAAAMNPQRLSAIPARMREFVKAKQTAGVVTIVGRHGKVAAFDAVGYQDIETSTPMRKNSLFRIASLTKPITCAAIMVLVDQGRLSVIDPVAKYLPEYKGMKVRNCEGSTAYGCDGLPSSRPVNLEDLMTHTSGLETSSAPLGGKEPATLAELAALGAKSQLLFQPGTGWNYSNTGYNVLGRIVEVVSKQPYDVFIKEHIFAPLRMDESYLFVPKDKLNRLAALYTLEEGKLVRSPDQRSDEKGPRIPKPAGGVVSTAEDMFRFNMMMRNKGILDGRRVLSEAAVTLMTTNHTGDLRAGWVPGVGHGYGYEVVRNAEGMFRYNSIGSFVKGGAFRTYEWVDPARDLVGVFMMQLTNGGGDTADEINAFMTLSAAAME